jgi:hypothetical protein
MKITEEQFKEIIVKLNQKGDLFPERTKEAKKFLEKIVSKELKK